MIGFSFANLGHVALLAGGERPPTGWLGPVADFTQGAFFIAENGELTPGSWGTASGQPNTPSGRLIFNTQAGNQLRTTGYAGGRIQVFAPGGPGAAALRLVVTRQVTGVVLYDRTLTESQDGSASVLLHDVPLPAYGAWHLEMTNTGPVNLDRIEWT